jgi:prepilin-type N-terminal cleavage/methylation domain-containing protein
MIATYQRLQRQRAEGEISGFTLIELLIVIVVLGILAAVVIFALGGITGKSQLAACQADGATVSTALSAFAAQNPHVSLTTTSNLVVGTSLGGPYIQSWPSATSYKFTISGTNGPNSGKGLHVESLNSDGTTKLGPFAYTGPASCGTGAGNAGLS